MAEIVALQPATTLQVFALKISLTASTLMLRISVSLSMRTAPGTCHMREMGDAKTTTTMLTVVTTEGIVASAHVYLPISFACQNLNVWIRALQTTMMSVK